MDKKYRVNELAKDLNIPVSEITDVVQEYFGVQKKSQASLSEDELSVVLEKYSQSNQVKNFNSYSLRQASPRRRRRKKSLQKSLQRRLRRSPNPIRKPTRLKRYRQSPKQSLK